MGLLCGSRGIARCLGLCSVTRVSVRGARPPASVAFLCSIWGADASLHSAPASLDVLLMADHFDGLAVFFDTYANSRHGYSFPRITAMVGDGRTAADMEGDNARNELAACSKNFRRRSVATKARLTYVKGKGLRLETQLDEWDKWDVCFDTPDIGIPISPFIGFTAATGDVADNHDIVGVSAYSATLYPQYRSGPSVGAGAPAPAGQKVLGSTRDHLTGGRAPVKTGGAAGWFLFVLKLIGVVAFIAFAVAAYVSLVKRKRKRGKRSARVRDTTM